MGPFALHTSPTQSVRREPASPPSDAAVEPPPAANGSYASEEGTTPRAIYLQRNHSSERLRHSTLLKRADASFALPEFPVATAEDQVQTGESRALYSDTRFEIHGPGAGTLVFLSEPVSLTDEEKEKVRNVPLVLDLQDGIAASRLFSSLAQNMINGDSLFVAAHPDAPSKVTVSPSSDQNHTSLYKLFKEHDQLRLFNMNADSVNVTRRGDERVRLWRDLEKSEKMRDGAIRRRSQKYLVDGRFDGEWRRALKASTYGAFDPVMKLKLLEIANSKGDARRVTIGRNIPDQKDVDSNPTAIRNDMDLLGFGNSVSRHHGNLSVAEDGKYWYMDEYSMQGTRVVMSLKHGQSREVFANLGIRYRGRSFLTFVGLPEDIEIPPTPCADLNRSFSALILALKNGETLSVAYSDSKGICYNQAVPSYAPCAFSITAKGNGRYELVNLHEASLDAIQLLNPTICRPAKMQVQENDKIVFSNSRNKVFIDGRPVLVNGGNDFCLIVPPPLDILSGQRAEIDMQLQVARGVTRNEDHSYTVLYDHVDPKEQQHLLDRVARMRLDSGFERSQQQQDFARCAGAGDLPAAKGLFEKEELNIDGTDATHSSPLSLAAQNLHVETVEWLLSKGASANKASGLYEETPLAALARGQESGYHLHTRQKQRALYKIARMLIDKGADVDVCDRSGSSVRAIAERCKADPNPVLRAIKGEGLGELEESNGTDFTFVSLGTTADVK